MSEGERARDHEPAVGHPAHGLCPVAVREGRLTREQPYRLGAMLHTADPGAFEVEALLISPERSQAHRRFEVGRDGHVAPRMNRDAQRLEA